MQTVPPPPPPHFISSCKDSLSGLFICKFVLFFCFLSLPSAPLSADIIYLKNGERIEGKFQGILDGYYQILLNNGKIKYIPEAELKDVQILEQEGNKRPQPASKAKKWTSWLPSFNDFNFLFLAVLGLGEAQYINEGLPETQPLSELGLGNVPGEAEVKYPESHSGPALQLAALAESPLGPGTKLLLGLDLTFLPVNKADQPLTVDTPLQIHRVKTALQS